MVKKDLNHKTRPLAETLEQMTGVLGSSGQARSTHQAADNFRHRTGP